MRSLLWPAALVVLLLGSSPAWSADPDDGDDALPAAAWMQRAVEQQHAGDVGAAEAAYGAAIEGYLADDDTLGERRARTALAMLLAREGELARAVEQLELALPLADASVDRAAPVATRLLLAEVQLTAGHPVDALPWADTALLAAAAADRPALMGAASELYLTTSLALAADDDALLGAIQHVDRRLADAESYGGVATLPALVFDVATERMHAGEGALALDTAELAVRLADRLGELRSLATFLVTIGYLATEAGEPARARAALERGLSLPDGRSVAMLASLARLEAREGWFPRAQALYDEAGAKAAEEDVAAELGLLLAHRAELHEARGRLDAARHDRETALRRLDSADDGVWIAGVRPALAAVQLRQRRFGEAEAEALRALAEVRDPVGAPVTYRRPDEAVMALLVLAGVHRHQGEDGAVAAELRQAVRVASDGADAALAAAAVSARVAWALENGDLEGGEAALAGIEPVERDAGAWRLEHARGRLWIAQARYLSADEAWQRFDEGEAALRRALAWQPRRDPLSALAHSVDLVADARAPRRALLALLVEQERWSDAMAVALGRELGDPGQCDPWGGPLLVLAEGDDELLSWLMVGDEPLELHRAPLGSGELDALVAQWRGVHAEPREPGKRALQDADAASRRLHELVFGPVLPTLERLDVGRLRVVAGGALQGMPLGALHDGERFAVERFVLSRLPLGRCGGVDEGKRKLATPIAVVGAGGAGPAAAALAGASRKARTIDGDGGTAEALMARLVEADAVVMSARAELNPLDGARSTLRLCGGSRTAAELAAWPMDARLVVLDGVDGAPLPTRAAASPWARGDDALLAFASSFVAAGAHAAAAPLWTPPDESSALLGDLFGDLGRRPAAEALARAQRAAIADGARPHAWAGWVLVGP